MGGAQNSGVPVSLIFNTVLSLDKDATVADVVNLEDGVVNWKWRWRRGLFQWEEEFVSEMQSLILQTGFKGEGVDRWVWHRDSNGFYFVKSAYQLLCTAETNSPELFYKKLWSGGAPLKVKAFVWKLFQDRVPSMQNLVSRNVSLNSSVCRGCNKEQESAAHLFFQCEKFSKVWYECLKWWGLMSSMQGNCKSHFEQFSGLVVGSVNQISLWEMIWYATIWVIWSARNALIFKGKEVVVSELLE